MFFEKLITLYNISISIKLPIDFCKYLIIFYYFTNELFLFDSLVFYFFNYDHETAYFVILL